MRLSLLDTRRPDVDHAELADNHALYKGGRCFRERLTRFLPRRPDEPEKVYEHRVEIAHYLNYAGPIVNYFMALLFSDELELVSEPAAPEWYAQDFARNCDGLGMDLHVMLRDRFTRAAVQRRSWVLVDFPADEGVAPADRKAWEQRGLGDAYLCALDDCDVLDWECDERGELEWAIVHQVDQRRRGPTVGRDMVSETWTVWGRERWERYRLTYKRGERPNVDTTEVPLDAYGPVATRGRVPLVRIELPEALYIMGTLASPQLEQMRSRNALSYSLQRTCYAMRVFKLADPDKPPVHGAGYGMVIGPNDSVEWDAPPADAFGPVAAYAGSLKDELYRVANQMALGVENNAAAVGRSGDSKQADHAATIVVVKAFAQEVREAAKRILDLVTLGRGELLAWDVGGMDEYAGDDVGAMVETAVSVETLSIPSVTFRREAATRVALAVVRDASPEVRKQIEKEIEAGITEEDVAAKEPPPKPGEPKPGETDAEDPTEEDAPDEEAD